MSYRHPLALRTLGLCAVALAVALPASAQMIPENAKAGECYAQVYAPPQFDTKTRRIETREASETLQVTQARYTTAAQRYVSREGGEKIVIRGVGGRPQVRTLPDGSIEISPTGYETTTERVMVKEASERLEVVPAEYETVTERVMVQPARTVWKPTTSRIYGAALRDADGNLVTRLDNRGEVLCLVEEPAEYRTVTKRVVKRAAQVRRVPVPAQYETVTKRIARTVAVERVPMGQEYDTYQRQVLASEGRVERTTVPADFETISESSLVAPAQMQLVRVLCEVNVTTAKVREIQRALRANGANTIGIDGVYGAGTAAAIAAFQRDRGLATGVGLTLDTLDALGVAY